MKLSDFIVRDAVIVDLQATEKEDAIREMVASLERAGCFAEADRENIIRAILSREELGSTGIGNGVAVPHTRHPKVDHLIGTVAVSHKGVNFAALDGEPVWVLVLIISPPSYPGDHLRALEKVSHLLKNAQFVTMLRRSHTVEQVQAELDEADQASP